MRYPIFGHIFYLQGGFNNSVSKLNEISKLKKNRGSGNVWVWRTVPLVGQKRCQTMRS